MVRLVEIFIDLGVMQATMNPVDEAVGKENKEGELQPVIPAPRSIRGIVIKLAVTAYFEEEHASREKSHTGHTNVGLLDFEPDLVLKELWVTKSSLIEDEDV